MYELLKKDFKLIFNFKRVILSFVFFFIIYMVFSSLFSDYMTERRLLDKVTIGILDEEQSLMSGMLIDNFESNEKFSALFEFQVSDHKSLWQAYNDNQLSAIVFIPESFTESLLYYENNPLKLVLNPNFPLKNVVLKNIMESYAEYIKSVDIATYSLYNTLKLEGLGSDQLKNVNDLFSVNMVMTALNRNAIFEYTAVDTFPSSSSKEYYIYAIIILLVLFISTSGSSLISSEINNHTVSRYISTGKRVIKFILSKIIVLTVYISAIALPFLCIMIVSTPALKGISIGLLLILFISTILFFTSVALLLGTLFNAHNINMLFSTLTTLVLGILGGNFIPLQIMPKFVQDISSFTPNFWILRSFLYLNTNSHYKEPLWVISSLLFAFLLLLMVQSSILKRGKSWKK